MHLQTMQTSIRMLLVASNLIKVYRIPSNLEVLCSVTEWMDDFMVLPPFQQYFSHIRAVLEEHTNIFMA